jgi:hypothetical protein
MTRLPAKAKQRKPGEWSSPALKWDEFVAEHKSKVAQGYRLLDISVYKQFTKID